MQTPACCPETFPKSASRRGENLRTLVSHRSFARCEEVLRLERCCFACRLAPPRQSLARNGRLLPRSSVASWQEDSDAEMAKAVVLAIRRDHLIASEAIRVSVARSVVTLDGSVPADAQKDMAEADAWDVFGDRVINNLVRR